MTTQCPCQGVLGKASWGSSDSLKHFISSSGEGERSQPDGLAAALSPWRFWGTWEAAGPGGHATNPTSLRRPGASAGSGSSQPSVMLFCSTSAETASTSGSSFKIQLEGKGGKKSTDLVLFVCVHDPGSWAALSSWPGLAEGRLFSRRIVWE